MLKNIGESSVKIKVTQKAWDDISSIEEYISKDNVSAAQATIQKTLDSSKNLVEFPNMGRTGRVPMTRELVVSGTPFIIIYTVRQNTIFILRILHAARKWP